MSVCAADFYFLCNFTSNAKKCCSFKSIARCTIYQFSFHLFTAELFKILDEHEINLLYI